ncbi:MAG: hypothetical protein RR058_07690 [Oscillospiraceae bacterium]
MKHIDRLMIKAKEIVNRCAEKLVLAFIYPDGNMWVADGRLWDGKPGSGETSATCKCRTIDEAIEALNQLAETHPNDKPVTIIIDDLVE